MSGARPIKMSYTRDQATLAGVSASLKINDKKWRFLSWVKKKLS
jgi:hypothetical protein